MPLSRQSSNADSIGKWVSTNFMLYNDCISAYHLSNMKNVSQKRCLLAKSLTHLAPWPKPQCSHGNYISRRIVAAAIAYRYRYEWFQFTEVAEAFSLFGEPAFFFVVNTIYCCWSQGHSPSVWYRARICTEITWPKNVSNTELYVEK